ncbi:MAG TPA: SprT family zinc-dependent metalloprotease [Bacteroidota bacterium]|nr:SprT family zinc-dependent metalloprotease [Bacteroidota bacterium]
MHQRPLIIENISIDVERKNIRSIRIAVYPRTGRVRLAAPHWVSEETLQAYAISRLPWIKKHRKRLMCKEPRAAYEYVSGEHHFYNGHPYLLEVVSSDRSHGAALENSTIKLFTGKVTTRHQRSEILAEWYRSQMKAQLPAMIAAWEPRMGVQVKELGIKRMKTRWGSCNIRTQRIWLNLELAKKSVQCLEYVLVHEMAHLLVPNHSMEFKTLMNTFLPNWKLLKQELSKNK